jgi:hypothetical protein
VHYRLLEEVGDLFYVLFFVTASVASHAAIWKILACMWNCEFMPASRTLKF